MTSCFHIAIAMKPIEGTFAENALKHGVAGLAIDACRVECKGESPTGSGNNMGYHGGGRGTGGNVTPAAGRFPANVIHDNSAEVLAGFPEQKSGGKRGGDTRIDKNCTYDIGAYNRLECRTHKHQTHGDSGSAARFFHAVEEYAAEAEE